MHTLYPLAPVEGGPERLIWHQFCVRALPPPVDAPSRAQLTALSSQPRRGGRWVRVLTWKPAHIEADHHASADEVRLGYLVPEPSNEADPLAVQVWACGRAIGYVEAWEAAHLQHALASAGTAQAVGLRPSRRVTSPRFDVLLPDLHLEGGPATCRLCPSDVARPRMTLDDCVDLAAALLLEAEEELYASAEAARDQS